MYRKCLVTLYYGDPIEAGNSALHCTTESVIDTACTIIRI